MFLLSKSNFITLGVPFHIKLHNFPALNSQLHETFGLFEFVYHYPLYFFVIDSHDLIGSSQPNFSQTDYFLQSIYRKLKFKETGIQLWNL